MQAIARVNRLFEENGQKKDFGYIVDYANVRDNLDTALVMYKALENFDPEDIQGLMTDVSEQVDKLPQLRSDLWDIFKGVRNKKDAEQMERHLADEKRRNDFYKALRDFGKCLSIALSSQKFMEKTPAEDVVRLRREFKMFSDMRVSVKHRYADDVDYSEYEPKIKKLLDTHIQSDNVVQMVAPVNILDPKFTKKLSDDKRGYDARGKAASADSIAHALKKTVTEKMDEDPAFYEKFSKMIQDVIDSFQAGKISEDEYFSKVQSLQDDFKSKRRDDVPEEISENEDAAAYYGVALSAFVYCGKCDAAEARRIAAKMALFTVESFEKHHKIQFWNDTDAQNRVRNELDDFLFDEIQVRERFGWSNNDIDSLEDKIMNVARRRSHE